MKTLVKTCQGSVVGILPRETPATLHGCGEDREGGSEIDRKSVLNNGSRQRAVESSTLGSQPCVQGDIIKEMGRPPDVKTQAQDVDEGVVTVSAPR